MLFTSLVLLFFQELVTRLRFGNTRAVDPRTGEVATLFDEDEFTALIPLGADDAFVVLTRDSTTRFEADLGEPTWRRTD